MPRLHWPGSRCSIILLLVLVGVILSWVDSFFRTEMLETFFAEFLAGFLGILIGFHLSQKETQERAKERADFLESILVVELKTIRDQLDWVELEPVNTPVWDKIRVNPDFGILGKQAIAAFQEIYDWIYFYNQRANANQQPLPESVLDLSLSREGAVKSQKKVLQMIDEFVKSMESTSSKNA